MQRWHASTCNATNFMANGTTSSNQMSQQVDTFIYLQLLNIYTVRNRHMENLLDCPVDGYKFEFETGADGKYKIQIHGKGVNKESSTVEMIKWDGKKFKRNM